MTIRPITPADAAAWTALREVLWSEEDEDFAAEVATFFAGAHPLLKAVLVAEVGGAVVGFAELSIRSYAEGCAPGPVAFLEGWYVDAAHRRQGLGRALMQASEDWGRAQGCTEMASDTWLDNDGGAAAHAALGFEEVERVICFRKDL